jgi:GTP-binding protein
MLVINKAEFVITAVKPQQYPATSVPEVAFVGRSNVGKSSIINTLTNRKNLARVGATPGKTREINFYDIDGKLYLVDLPGYGYAKVSKEKKSTWNEIIETYLFSRHQLKLIILLVDIRHAPSSDDKIMYDWIKGHNMPHMIIATKADKVSRGQLKQNLNMIKAELAVSDGIEPIAFSAETKQGKDEILSLIESKLI